MKKILLVLPLLIAVLGLLVSIRSSRVKPTEMDLEEVSRPQEFQLVEVANGLNVPWSLVFTSAKRALISERDGNIRILENGSLRPRPLFTFAEVYSVSEAGLMGLAIDPDYQTNKNIYACLAYNQNGKPRIKVVRMKDNGSTAVVEEAILDDILAAPNHDGCRLKFGPDGKLYITTGDAQQRDLAQKIESLSGKILRVNADGSVPADNPFNGSPVYSYGHRNPQGIDWDSRTGLLWETEHGPSGFDGPGGGDEINLIRAGANYGWPLVSHERRLTGTEFPKLLFTPAVAPAAGMFYTGDLFPEFKNNFFFASLRGEGIYRLLIEGESVVSFEKLSFVDVGRVREVTQGPDGAIYFMTSNRDGRGRLREGDDKIYRLVPKE